MTPTMVGLCCFSAGWWPARGAGRSARALGARPAICHANTRAPACLPARATADWSVRDILVSLVPFVVVFALRDVGLRGALAFALVWAWFVLLYRVIATDSRRKKARVRLARSQPVHSPASVRTTSLWACVRAHCQPLIMPLWLLVMPHHAQVWPLLDIIGALAFPILLGLTYIGPGAYGAVRCCCSCSHVPALTRAFGRMRQQQQQQQPSIIHTCAACHAPRGCSSSSGCRSSCPPSSASPCWWVHWACGAQAPVLLCNTQAQWQAAWRIARVRACHRAQPLEWPLSGVRALSCPQLSIVWRRPFTAHYARYPKFDRGGAGVWEGDASYRRWVRARAGRPACALALALLCVHTRAANGATPFAAQHLRLRIHWVAGCLHRHVPPGSGAPCSDLGLPVHAAAAAAAGPAAAAAAAAWRKACCPCAAPFRSLS